MREKEPVRRFGALALFGWGAKYGLFALGLACSPAAMATELQESRITRTALSTEDASHDARRVAAWVIETDNNQGLPFIIVDKIDAEALAFDRQGLLLGIAPVLLGIARGDDSPPGIGERALSRISPAERITPAGRFVAARGLNLAGDDILWVDYESALSLHPVVTGAASDRRLHRLATTTTLDNRISYGCINVPAEFYRRIVRPLFSATIGVVYILPETRSIEDVFFTPPVALAEAIAP